MMIKKKMWNKYFQIDPLTAPIVLEAFQKYDEGMTMKEIVDYLRLKGLRTKKNGEISINSLTRSNRSTTTSSPTTQALSKTPRA